jgi:type I restriction enzyme M protein
LPDQLFYNTGIFTYVWILTNRKRPERRGKVQLINAVELYRTMRKSLNNKRNEIAPEHIEEITRLYGDFADGERSKIFANTDFGYRQVTIERPLRLNFQASPERIERLREAKPFQNLATSKKKGKPAEADIEAGRKLQEAVIQTLGTLDAAKLYTSRAEFEADLLAAFTAAEIKLAAPLKKAVLAALSERDETAEICLGADGNAEPDPELRDYENVPLREDIREYFDREVRPHVPDAWINETVRDEKDGQVGKVGYEIPLTRHFYKYTPPRPLEEIEADIAGLEKDIVSMLREVVG